MSITSIGDPLAGKMYDIECLVTILEGIRSTPILTWLDSDGNRIDSGDGIVVGPPTANSLLLDFNFLEMSHSGKYTCTATLFSLALQVPLTATASIYTNVQRKNL